MDEQALIQHAQAGDLDSFNRLVLAYQDQVYSQALRVLDDPAAADDAAQEAFISAYRHLQSYRGGSFRAWLLRIVTNACYDELRRRRRRPAISLEPVDEDGEEVESPQWLADLSDLPEDRAEQADLQRAIQRCIQDLPEDFRQAVLLVDVEGLNYDEAAQALSSPVGTVKSRLARARLRLRACLQSVWELLPGNLRLM